MDLKRLTSLCTVIIILKTFTSFANVFADVSHVTSNKNSPKTYISNEKRSVNGRLIFGLTSGEITRCVILIGDLKCTKIYEQDSGGEYFSPVASLAPYEEYVYLGLESGEIRRCLLNDKVEKCLMFHKAVSGIQALVIENDVLYAASSDGILTCHLHKSNCEIFIDEISPVYSLLVWKDELFIGSEGIIIRCLLSGVFRTNCLTFAKVESAVMSLGHRGTYLYAGTKDGRILRYETDILEYVIIYENGSEIRTLNIEGEFLHAAVSGGLIQCDLAKTSFELSKDNTYTTLETKGDINNTCTTLETKEDILSIASVYNTIPMVYYFENEDKICSWQGRKCPPYIIYYDEKDRAPLELKVRDGKVYFAGRLFNTSYADFSHSGPKAIFVMDATGRIFVSNQHPFLLLHHSSLISGNFVASAGEITAINGEIKSITTCSGHYRASFEIGKQIVASLKSKGYVKYIKLIDCSKLRLLIDLDYNKLDLYYKVMFNNVTMDDVIYKDGFEKEN